MDDFGTGARSAMSAPGAVLANKHAIITGGGRGIGLAIARALHAQGATLTLMGRDAARLADAAREFGARAEPCDVADEASVGSAFASAQAVQGPAAILINNAGIAESAPIHKMSAGLWHRTLAINLTGTFLCTQQVIGGMMTARWGRIVNVASIAGLTGAAYVSAYVASKHGVVGFTRSVALDVAKHGITVNAVCPGYTDTDMAEKAISTITSKTGRSREQALAELTRNNPQGRLTTPDEVANAVLWLCMPGSEAITGQAIAVAGGEVMH